MIPRTFGKYRILSWLGGGQFGDVYLAQDSILQMEFALKVARMRPADIQMLADEARLLASLNHPNIVRFYSADRIQGRLALVAEYVPGTSLRERLEQGRLDPQDAGRITRGILAALAYAHGKGMIHRDLKPENVLLTTQGQVKVADFGLARFLKQGSLAASVAGTPFYMAPEAWEGRFSQGSDLWSVGVILYEMLAGVLPFYGENYEEIRRKLVRKQPAPIHKLRPQVPARYQRIVDELLAKDPLARPKNAKGLMDELSEKTHTGLAGGKISSKPNEGFDLTPQQQDIVKSKDKRVLVVGAAGSGKTTLLINRANHLLNTGVAPHRILMLAFTRRAAGEMRDRLEKLVGRAIPDCWIETFHSFGARFLKTEGWRLDLPPEFRVENPEEILTRLCKKWGKNRGREFLNLLSELRYSSVRLEDYEPSSPGEKELKEFWQDYDDAKRKQESVDFDDLIIYSLELLADDVKIRRQWQHKFSQILVDELQDLNPAQFKLLEALCGPQTGLFLTGDATQSIYGWRGADPGLISASQKVFESITRHELSASFRVGSELLKVAGNLMAHSFEDSAIPSLSLTRNQGSFRFHKAANVSAEAAFVAERITKLIEEKGYKPSDFAVISRTNNYLGGFKDALSGKRIPASVIGTGFSHGRQEIEHLISILSSVRKNAPITAASSWQWLLSLKPETNPLESEQGTLKLSPQAKTRSRKKIAGFFADLSGLSGKLNEITASDLLDFLKSHPAAAKKLSSPAVREAFYELTKASRRFQKGELGLFLDHLALLEDLELAQWSRDAVRLLSIHSAKGLEFGVVFLVGLAEGLFPTTRSLSDLAALAEERRLCYVGLTRSQDLLYVTMPSRMHGMPARPSRFLLEMLGLL